MNLEKTLPQQRPPSSNSSFWISKGWNNLKVICDGRSGHLPFLPLCQVQRRGAACSQGHSTGFWEACGSPGIPRWGTCPFHPAKPWLFQLSQHLPFYQQDWQLACENNGQHELSQEENIWKTSDFNRLHPRLSRIHAFFSILFVHMLPLQPLTQLSDRFGAETPLLGDDSGKDPTLHKGFASKLFPVVAPKFLRLQGDSKLVHIWLAGVCKEKVFPFMTQLCSTFPRNADPTHKPSLLQWGDFPREYPHRH